jgi:hypothetical protein
MICLDRRVCCIGNIPWYIYYHSEDLRLTNIYIENIGYQLVVITSSEFLNVVYCLQLWSSSLGTLTPGKRGDILGGGG